MTESQHRNYWRLVMLSTGSALLIALVLLLGYHWYSARENLQKHLTMQARLLGANLTAAVVFEDMRTVNEIMGTVEASPSIAEAAVYRIDGSLMARYLRPGAKAGFPDRAPAHEPVFSSADLRLAVPVQLDGRTVGSMAIRATLDDLYSDLGRIFTSLFLIVAVSAMLGVYISRKMRLQMEESESAIERMALFDRVTGLPNRHAFELTLSQTLQRHARDGSGSALLFIDVDDFKKVNDLFGHQVGDAVLKAIGERLGRTLRGADVVARIGGDEFAVILTNTTTADDIARVAENLVRVGAKPFDTGRAPARVGFSIGICMIPQDAADMEKALHNADLAMYHAKQLGKNTYRFFSEGIADGARDGAAHCVQGGTIQVT
jgi:diguanylate cyclase (GGDEF)-like protein